MTTPFNVSPLIRSCTPRSTAYRSIIHLRSAATATSPAANITKDVQDEAARLTSRERRGAKRWHTTPDQRGLQRVFRFKSFKTTWKFMNHVAEQCSVVKHHPTWTNVYNRTHIIWTTHVPASLSVKDVEMARFCDEAATTFGELEPTGEQQREDESDLTRSPDIDSS